MLHALIDKVSNQPALFLFCRGVLEGNFRVIRRLIQKRLPAGPETKVLDIACGPGAFSDLFPPEGYHGIDVNVRYIDYAKRHYRGSFRTMDARSLDYPDGSFDQALIFGLLHHLRDEDAREVLEGLARVLRPGGLALVIEDIPTESRLNLIGHVLHRIENGHHIRPSVEYRRLLSEHFELGDEEIFRSGICDYYTAILRHDHRSPTARAPSSGS